MSVPKIKDAVRERDGNRCTGCGLTEKMHVRRYGQRLEVHRPRPGFPYSMDNGVTLCHRCHIRWHEEQRTGPTVPVRIHRSMSQKLEVLSIHHCVSVPDYLSKRFTSQIDKEFAAVVEQMQKAAKE